MKKRDLIRHKTASKFREKLFIKFAFIAIVSILIYAFVYILNQNYSIMIILFVLTILTMIYLFFQSIIFVRLNLESGKSFYSIATYVLVFVWITFLVSILLNISQINNWGTLSYDCSKNLGPQLNESVSKEFFYFSATTILTIGYGDICPLGFSRVLASITGFLGMFMYVGFIFLLVKYYIINNNYKG